MVARLSSILMLALIIVSVLGVQAQSTILVRAEDDYGSPLPATITIYGSGLTPITVSSGENVSLSPGTYYIEAPSSLDLDGDGQADYVFRRWLCYGKVRVGDTLSRLTKLVVEGDGAIAARYSPSPRYVFTLDDAWLKDEGRSATIAVTVLVNGSLYGILTTPFTLTFRGPTVVEVDAPYYLLSLPSGAYPFLRVELQGEASCAPNEILGIVKLNATLDASNPQVYARLVYGMRDYFVLRVARRVVSPLGALTSTVKVYEDDEPFTVQLEASDFRLPGFFFVNWQVDGRVVYSHEPPKPAESVSVTVNDYAPRREAVAVYASPGVYETELVEVRVLPAYVNASGHVLAEGTPLMPLENFTFVVLARTRLRFKYWAMSLTVLSLNVTVRLSDPDSLSSWAEPLGGRTVVSALVAGEGWHVVGYIGPFRVRWMNPGDLPRTYTASFAVFENGEYSHDVSCVTTIACAAAEARSVITDEGSATLMVLYRWALQDGGYVCGRRYLNAYVNRTALSTRVLAELAALHPRLRRLYEAGIPPLASVSFARLRPTTRGAPRASLLVVPLSPFVRGCSIEVRPAALVIWRILPRGIVNASLVDWASGTTLRGYIAAYALSARGEVLHVKRLGVLRDYALLGLGDLLEDPKVRRILLVGYPEADGALYAWSPLAQILLTRDSLR